MAVSDKEIVRGMLDRQILNIYMPLKNSIASNIPVFAPMVKNFEGQIISWINKKVDLLMDLSFPTAEVTADEGIANMNEIINVLVLKKLEEFGISQDVLTMDLSKILK